MQLLNSFFEVSGEEELDGNYMCKIEIKPDHFIFKAHFPGNPIVPGVCQVQIVKELLERKMGRPIYLIEVKNIKYLSVMRPDEQTDYQVVFQKIMECGDSCKTTVVYSTEEKPYAKLSLTFSYTKI